MYVTTKKMGADMLAWQAEEVGRLHYDGNVTAEVEHIRGNQYRVKIGTRDSRADGSRVSWSGRHGKWACWHVFRDVVAAWLLWDPKATIRTGVATYKGALSFLDQYEGTFYGNTGSIMQPLAMGEACSHGGPGGHLPDLTDNLLGAPWIAALRQGVAQ